MKRKGYFNMAKNERNKELFEEYLLNMDCFDKEEILVKAGRVCGNCKECEKFFETYVEEEPNESECNLVTSDVATEGMELVSVDGKDKHLSVVRFRDVNYIVDSDSLCETKLLDNDSFNYKVESEG